MLCLQQSVTWHQWARGQGPTDLLGPSTGTPKLQVQVMSTVLRIAPQVPTSGHASHTESAQAPSWGTPAPPGDFGFPLKDRKISLPRRRQAPFALSTFAVEGSIKRGCVKIHGQPISASPRALCRWQGQTPRKEKGALPKLLTSPCTGATRHKKLTCPHAFEGRPDARGRTITDLL